MKSVVATITLVLVAAASVAHATAMVEVPNPPPYLPPPAPTPEQQRRDRGKVILVGGLVLLGVGTGLTGGAIGFAEDHRCFLPLSCLFGPATNDPLIFEGLALS